MLWGMQPSSPSISYGVGHANVRPFIIIIFYIGTSNSHSITHEILGLGISYKYSFNWCPVSELKDISDEFRVHNHYATIPMERNLCPIFQIKGCWIYLSARLRMGHLCDILLILNFVSISLSSHSLFFCNLSFCPLNQSLFLNLNLNIPTQQSTQPTQPSSIQSSDPSPSHFLPGEIRPQDCTLCVSANFVLLVLSSPFFNWLFSTLPSSLVFFLIPFFSQFFKWIIIYFFVAWAGLICEIISISNQSRVLNIITRVETEENQFLGETNFFCFIILGSVAVVYSHTFRWWFDNISHGGCDLNNSPFTLFFSLFRIYLSFNISRIVRHDSTKKKFKHLEFNSWTSQSRESLVSKLSVQMESF
ncbi:hypothetical protein VP01_5842g1 [Puccinia sorghi]|uniref:Uncharacterized protein n=1 Tax=Puccinia sorghi TaxID=27349 RepID=A0A0L6UI24_9BASI|nr:hypothetical protein VP01_5842g1 [Puccinia sorghi]